MPKLLGAHNYIYNMKNPAKLLIRGAKSCARGIRDSKDSLRNRARFWKPNRGKSNSTADHRDETNQQPVQCAQNIEVVDSGAFSTKPTRVVEYDDGDKICLAIIPDQETFHRLRKGVEAHHRVREEEDHAEAALKELRAKYDPIQRELEALSRQIQKVEGSDNTEEQQSNNLAEMRAEFQSLREQKQSILDAKCEIEETLDGEYKDLRFEQIEAWKTLEKLFVDYGLMARDREDAPEGRGSSEVDDDDDDLEYADEVTASQTQGIEDTVEICKEPSLVREGLEAGEYSLEEEELKRKRHLYYQFDTRRMVFHAAENELDRRAEHFAKLREDREERQANNEEAETLSEMGLREFKETQRLTRRVIESEEAYYEAKKAAVAAGVQLRGSDIVSGFIDDVDDGYKLSLEDDMIAHVDREGIERWLGDVTGYRREGEGKTGPFDNPEYITPSVPEDLEAWGAHSVSMQDNWSMAADDPWKRKIQTWNAKQQRLRMIMVDLVEPAGACGRRRKSV